VEQEENHGFDMQLLSLRPRQATSSLNSEIPARSHPARQLWRVTVVLLLFFQSPVFGKPPEVINPATLNQKVYASSALLVDAASGRVLFSKNPTAQFPPASTTKLLTGLLVFEHTKLEGNVLVEKSDTMVQPSSIPLKVGETVSVQTLVQSLLIGSDNDSAMALARFTSGSVQAFVGLMNTRARELGCSNSAFKTPNGLPAPNQVTTARDLLKIFQAAMAIPELRQICQTRSLTLTTAVGKQVLKNHNKLLGVYPGMGPAKTGWTRASEHTYAASATRDGRELQLILLHSTNKWADAELLFNYGFQATRNEKANTADHRP
jgi:serine-type D-Ala-D-Ala carboxypeptidase (penicillin-binding protein 5/6)